VHPPVPDRRIPIPNDISEVLRAAGPGIVIRIVISGRAEKIERGRRGLPLRPRDRRK
jgi:hypothetical protein